VSARRPTETAEAGELREWLISQRSRLRERIEAYVAIETRSPHERSAEPFLRGLMSSIGYELVAAGDWERARRHPDWSPHPAGQDPNACWIARSPADGDERPEVIVNAHVDVVPSAPNQAAVEDEDWIGGRGACDTKANLLLVVEALRYLATTGRRPRYRVRFHLPCYEEIGGNGTLALVLADEERPEPAGAICLEPTDLFAYVGHRGCLTYRLEIVGRTSHMGSESGWDDPIHGAARVTLALRELEAELNAEARSEPGFAWTQRPLQVTVAEVSGGGWIGSSPDRCRLAGNVGVPPGLPLEAIEERLLALGRRAVDDDLALHWGFSTGLRNQSYAAERLGRLQELVDRSRSGGERRIWSASCDARHYHRIWSVPTVVFGAGSLGDAHTPDERVSLAEVEAGIAMVANWLAEPAD
jgi:acetylornithine deacetylase